MRKKTIISNILIVLNILIILAIALSFVLVCFSNRSLVSIMGSESVALYMNDETIYEEDGNFSNILMIQNTANYDVNDKIVFRTKDIFDNDVYQLGYVNSLEYDGDTYLVTIRDNLSATLIEVSYSDCVGKVLFSSETIGAFVKLCDNNISEFYIAIQAGILFVVLSSIVMIILLRIPNKTKLKLATNTASNDGVTPSTIAPVKIEDELSLDITLDDLENISLSNLFEENETVIDPPTIDTPKENADEQEENIEEISEDNISDTQPPHGVELDTQTVTSSPFLVKATDKASAMSKINIIDEPEDNLEEIIIISDTETSDTVDVSDEVYISNSSSGDSSVDEIINNIINSLMSKSNSQEQSLALTSPNNNVSLQLINAILEDNAKEITQEESYSSDEELEALKQEILNDSTYK